MKWRDKLLLKQDWAPYPDYQKLNFCDSYSSELIWIQPHSQSSLLLGLSSSTGMSRRDHPWEQKAQFESFFYFTHLITLFFCEFIHTRSPFLTGDDDSKYA